MTQQKQAAKDIPLLPFELFKQTAKDLLAQSKRDSDLELARFQAANVKKREARKKKR